MLALLASTIRDEVPAPKARESPPPLAAQVPSLPLQVWLSKSTPKSHSHSLSSSLQGPLMGSKKKERSEVRCVRGWPNKERRKQNFSGPKREIWTPKRESPTRVTRVQAKTLKTRKTNEMTRVSDARFPRQEIPNARNSRLARVNTASRANSSRPKRGDFLKKSRVLDSRF